MNSETSEGETHMVEIRKDILVEILGRSYLCNMSYNSLKFLEIISFSNLLEYIEENKQVPIYSPHSSKSFKQTLNLPI